jgi:hypothetical protein
VLVRHLVGNAANQEMVHRPGDHVGINVNGLFRRELVFSEAAEWLFGDLLRDTSVRGDQGLV